MVHSKARLFLRFMIAFWLVSFSCDMFGQRYRGNKAWGQLPHHSSVLQSQNGPLAITNAIPHSLTDSQRHWLQILSAPAPSIDDQVQTCEELIQKLRSLGLPFLVDETAQDDQLSAEDFIDLPFSNQNLFGRLLIALREKNATFVIQPNCLRIISRDNCEDPDFLMLITYDVSGIPLDSDSLMNAITSVMEGEKYHEMGGYMAINLLQVNHQRLLVVNANMETHLKLSQLTESILVHTGVRPLAVRSTSLAMPHPYLPPSSLASLAKGATPVALPRQQPKSGMNIPSGRGGIENAGGMGGAFSIGIPAR